MADKKKKKICDVCGGTGQISFFKGVSRFLLSTEECLACDGTGYIGETAGQKTEKTEGGKPKKRKQNK